MTAAIDFVQVCGDHASLLSGRRRLAEVVAAMDMRKVLSQMHVACLELLTGIHCINNIITQLFAYKFSHVFSHVFSQVRLTCGLNMYSLSCQVYFTANAFAVPSQHYFSSCTIVSNPDQIFPRLPYPTKNELSLGNWGLIRMHCGILLHQSDCMLKTFTCHQVCGCYGLDYS